MNPEVDKPALPPLSPATLYLVATPIGNLEDMTPRAVRTLRECDVVAAEDTRRAGMLLQRFGMHRPLISYHRFNEARRSEEILSRLGRGEVIALVTDAGVPGISDPGQRIVAAAVAAGFRVESVPGACAVITALAASGLPTEEFHFAGFLPHKSGQRRRELERLRQLPGTLALYESPFRIERLLGELAELMPERPVVLARELTKKFEEFLRGTPALLLERTRGRSWKGELTVLIGPGGDAAADGDASVDTKEEHFEHVSGPHLAPTAGAVTRLALAQMRVEPGRPDENLIRAEAAIRQAREDGAAIVLLPEVLDFGWTHSSAREGAGRVPDGETCRRLSEAAANHGIHVCAGLAERCGERLFNAAVLFGPDGELLLHHRKIHEIPFARALYATGDRLGVVDTSLGRLGLMICADALAPGMVITRTLAAMGAELILSPCAWAVPPDHDHVRTPYGTLWKEHYGPVAQENRLWIAGCSNVGPVTEGEWRGWRCIGNSLVVGPEGDFAGVCRHGEDADEQIVVEIPRRLV
jgi:16S rRNA (cytidine(1402)-2'-O)-methyltransferase